MTPEWTQAPGAGFTAYPEAVAFQSCINGVPCEVCELPMGQHPSVWIPFVDGKRRIGFEEFAPTEKEKAMAMCIDMAEAMT